MRFVVLDIMAVPAGVFLQLAFGRVEGIAQHDINILVLFLADHDRRPES